MPVLVLIAYLAALTCCLPVTTTRQASLAATLLPTSADAQAAASPDFFELPVVCRNQIVCVTRLLARLHETVKFRRNIPPLRP